jgi:hypothetical protein
MPVGCACSGHTGEKDRHFHRRGVESRTVVLHQIGLAAGETAL